MPASPWKSGNAALGKFGLVGRLRPFPTLWTPNHSSCVVPWSLSFLVCSSASCLPLFLCWTVSSLRRALMSVLSRFTCSLLAWPCPARSPSAAWPRSCPLSPRWKPRLRKMFRLSWKRLRNLWSRSLPRGLSLVSRTSVPALAPTLPCPRPLMVVLVAPSCSISVAPTGLSVKSSPVAPPDRLVSSCRHSCSSAFANGPVESRGTAGVARSPTPRESRAAASAPTATVPRKASQRRRASGAAEAQQRRRDKHPPSSTRHQAFNVA